MTKLTMGNKAPCMPAISKAMRHQSIGRGIALYSMSRLLRKPLDATIRQLLTPYCLGGWPPGQQSTNLQWKIHLLFAGHFDGLGCLFLFSGIYFLGPKTVPDRIPEVLFFSCVFQRIFSQERGFGGVAGIPVFFFRFYRFFFGNSYGTGIPVFTPDSSEIRRIPPDSCSRQLLSG